MKKGILIALIAIVALSARGQQSPVGKIFDSYSGRKGFSSVYISHAMFEIFAALDSSGTDKDFKDITSRLNCIRILSADDKIDPAKGEIFYREMAGAFAAPAYEDLMVVKDGGEDVKFMTRKQGDRIMELVMVVGGASPCLIELEGDINLKQVAKLSKSMNIKGLDHLNDINAKKTNK